MEDTNWKQMGRKLVGYVIWCGGHQLVFEVFEVCELLRALTHFCPFVF